ncbi:MAG TPA: AMP-binding protein [Polyangia bacterium]|nr:AMP-binding protein [Polyangia bacterium]
MVPGERGDRDRLTQGRGTTDGGLGVRPRPAAAPLALGETPRSWGQLLSDAAAVAARLPAGHGAVNGADDALMIACVDRYHFAVALLATWHVGRVAALPPNGRVETIDGLCVAENIPLVLHDGGGRGGVDVRPLLDGGLAPIEEPRFAPGRALVRVHTSGSTGTHVACPKTAAQILGEAGLLCTLFDLGPEARILCTVPPHHIYGLLFGVLLPLVGGATFVRSTPHHAETIAAQAAGSGANVLISVPAHLHGLGVLTPGALPPLRRIVSSGAPLPPGTAAAVASLTGTPVTEILGSTETGGMAWRQSDGHADDDGWQPFPGVQVSAGDDGLMRISSPFADRGPDENGSLRGADRVAVLPDGRFRLRGRADAVVKIGGQRIATTEVERRLRQIAGVRDAAVLTVDVAGPRQHQLWAAVAGDGLSVPALRAALLRWLDPVAIPRRFRVVDELPREENGKLTRARLRALFADTGHAGAPETVTLTRTIPVDSPFFEGHFEEFAILPGVVQLHDVLLRPVRQQWPALWRLRKILRLKFRRPIRPGDALAIDLTRDADKVTFEIRSAKGPVSSGVFVFDTSEG